MVDSGPFPPAPSGRQRLRVLLSRRENAYAAAAKIRFDGAFYRRDIAHRALHRH